MGVVTCEYYYVICVVHGNMHPAKQHHHLESRAYMQQPTFVSFLQSMSKFKLLSMVMRPDLGLFVWQVGTEQVTKTIEGYILAATVGEGGITRAMQVRQVMVVLLTVFDSHCMRCHASADVTVVH